MNNFYSSTIDPVVWSQNVTIKHDLTDIRQRFVNKSSIIYFELIIVCNKFTYYRKCNSILNYVDDCESLDEDLLQALNQKNI